MKRIIALVLMLSACAPSPEAIAEAIARTQVAAPTITPSITPAPTPTPEGCWAADKDSVSGWIAEISGPFEKLADAVGSAATISRPSEAFPLLGDASLAWVELGDVVPPPCAQEAHEKLVEAAYLSVEWLGMFATGDTAGAITKSAEATGELGDFMDMLNAIKDNVTQ